MEENNENRDCICGEKENKKMKCHYMPQGINAAFGYNSNCSENDNLENNNELREKMLKEIKCLNFAIVELAEYLDTHPDDKKAICLHKEYSNQLEDLKDKYQRVFGPLSIYYPCNKWRWIEEPWPWERSDIDVDL